jgi:hypothetical protein
MPPLTVFPLPLASGAPPDGYGWPGCDRVSSELGTTVFQPGIDQLDRFLGRRIGRRIEDFDEPGQVYCGRCICAREGVYSGGRLYNPRI